MCGMDTFDVVPPLLNTLTGKEEEEEEASKETTRPA